MSKGFASLLREIFLGIPRSGAKPAEIEIAVSRDPEVPSIYASRARALIMRDILLPGEEGRDVAPAAPSDLQTIKVSEAFKSARDALFDCAAELAQGAPEATRRYIDKVVALLEKQICHIAFIGQINSGKSSLINAFVEKPALLPTEITPWTTVVTNLYFGIPNAPRGAMFEFFDRNEWDQLASGNPQLRELTERVLPDFDWTAMRRQIEAMRAEAERRLGLRFEDMLGQRHAEAEITTELLERYVCAESIFGAGEGRPVIGEFAMITKAAHLYFGLDSFFYPTVVIDTPGINDPFLVRDEITRQNLVRANIFVVVVTARQPLSLADVDLLRLLRGLNKSRIIIFVNKIDEMEDFPSMREAIVARIKGVLDREFPGADIPIVFGSAKFALAALGATAQNPPGEDLQAQSLWAPDSAVRSTIGAEDALMRSGVPALALAVSERMQIGPIADGVRFATAALAALARNRCTAAEGGALGLTSPIQEARGLRESAETELARVIEDGLSRIRRKLLDRTDAFFAALPAQGRPDPTPLRAELETSFTQDFAALYATLAKRCRGMEAEIQRLLAEAAAASGVPFHYAPLPILKLSPDLAALGEPVLFTVTALPGARPVRPQAEQIAPFMRQQFDGIVDRLVRANAEELRHAFAFATDHIEAHLSSLHALADSAGCEAPSSAGLDFAAAARLAERLGGLAQGVRA
jgi:hypothetical protein